MRRGIGWIKIHWQDYRHKKKTAVLLFLAVVVFGAGMIGRKNVLGSKSQDMTRLPGVSVVERGDLSQRITASGTVSAAECVINQMNFQVVSGKG